jgi:hypothetical protein
LETNHLAEEVALSLTLETRLVHNSRVVYRVIDGEAVLVDPAIGKVRVLNELGGRIWELIDGQRTLAEIVALICQEYDVPPDQVTSDVLAFLEELTRKGLCS